MLPSCNAGMVRQADDGIEAANPSRELCSEAVLCAQIQLHESSETGPRAEAT